MAAIFTNEPGVAYVVPDPSVLPITFVFSGWGGGPYRNAITSGISISSRGNYQFLHTLRNFIYVYVFGEQMGRITITGRTFMANCHFFNDSGISNTIEYYANYSISRTGTPVGIQIGYAAFYGFLVGAEVGIVDAESRLGKFAFTFESIPQ